MWASGGFEALRADADAPVGLTIGAFDGVHVGHQAMLRWFVSEAHAAGLQAVVLTFDPLPRQVLSPPPTPPLLSSLAERQAQLALLGVDGVVTLRFDRATAALTAQDFMAQIMRAVDLRGLWVGADFALGRERGGSVSVLREIGEARGFVVHTFAETIAWCGAPVRSSRIRRALQAGDVSEACGCMGRPYRLAGLVVHGDHRGHTLGFPTANLAVSADRQLPAWGVYVTRAHLPQGSFESVTNVGGRPTFNHRPPTVEAYLLDFSADLYGATLKLDFLHRLRTEEKFTSVEALIVQMQHDVAGARAWFHNEDEYVLCPNGCRE
ncbi:MAG TPA: riboflavin biosynthesis protein RibF [Anaerolineae bacterium]|nr:riboflavin biosynthesis protein RibF [Anaerolineae bacterium]